MAANRILNRSWKACTAALLIFLAGCATIDDYQDPRDPLEGWNRLVYDFNDVLDRTLIRPLAEGYQAVIPAPLNRGVTNFFSNLADIQSAINNLLQFKLKRAGSDLGRVTVNTTMGVFGLVDVASNLNLQKYGEDFGQTLGVWGVGEGPYIVLPLLGPSSARGVAGRVGDWFTDPVNYISSGRVRYGLIALRALDKRANLLGASRVMEEAALDPYSFVRDAYLQKRRNDVYDGNPPSDELDELFDDDFDEDEEFKDEFREEFNEEFDQESTDGLEHEQRQGLSEQGVEQQNGSLADD